MNRHQISILMLAILALAIAGCSDDDPADPQVVVPAEKAFIGSETCLECHAEAYGMWAESGHPYKLTKIEGVAPTDLFPSFSAFPNDPIAPPAGYDWSDISYTIGGYGWKMRWIDNDGYIITQNGDTQYNFENQTRVAYHANDPIGTKPYDCGRCHTTGWEDSDDSITANNQDGLEGMVGTFFAGGVHCEECHGMGNQHAVKPADYPMTKDSSSALCGRCHTRNADNSIAASSGFVKHHEQYDEWLHSPHNDAVGCNDCHDPHSSVKYDGDAAGMGTTTSCTDCHSGYDADGLNHFAVPTCVDCHMPKASKSAIKLNDYVGDIRTHIFAINTAPVGKAEGMFSPEGNLVLEDNDGMAMVTLDFACYSCHKSTEDGEGSARYLTVQQLSDKVLGLGDYADEDGIHGGAKRMIARR